MDKVKKYGKAVVNYKGFGLICCCIVVLIFAAIFSRSMFEGNAIVTMLNDNAVYAILAVGMCFVLLTGGMDISVGSTLAVAAVTTTKFMTMAPDHGGFTVIWILLAIGIGGLCGLVNGILIGKLKIVPLIATLGTMYIYRGLAFLITNGQWYTSGQYKDYFLAISQSRFGFSFGGNPNFSITTMTLVAILILVFAGLFIHLTKPGRRLYAIGTSETSAQIAGINTDNVKILAYVLCGCLAGLAGLLFSSDATQISSEIGNGYEMTAVAICVIGGVANTGGKGRIDCLILGIIFMSLLTKLLNMLPGFSSWSDAMKGAIIIIAVVINVTNDNIKARRDALEMGKRL